MPLPARPGLLVQLPLSIPLGRDKYNRPLLLSCAIRGAACGKACAALVVDFAVCNLRWSYSAHQPNKSYQCMLAQDPRRRESAAGLKHT